MAVAPASPDQTSDPTLALILARMMERDDNQRDAWAHLTGRVSDQNSVLQGLQGEVSRLVKLAERQDEYNQRQIVLQEQTTTHAATFERAFNDIKEITRNLDEVTKTVTAYSGSLQTLRLIAGAVLVIGMGIASFTYATLTDRIADVKLQHTQDIATATAAREKLRDEVSELQQGRAIK